MSQLADQNILLGVTGGIAAYKSCEIVRRLMDLGASVRVVLTSGAQAFVTPLTFQALSGNPVHTELLDPTAESGMGHIELARWAHRILIAPASANFIERLAAGRADDLLSTICLATNAPLILAPAMNQVMWLNPATQRNMALVEQRGAEIIGPDSGDQACGEVGPGRMSQPEDILARLCEHQTGKSLVGKKVVITAGPTREALDPVRYLSNYSSGKMGYALAAACANAGAETILVSGPVALACPYGVRLIEVESAIQMHAEVLSLIDETDIFIGAAAVSDYRAELRQPQKIKKHTERLSITLVKNPDIVSEVAAHSRRPFVVGFAAESENLVQNASDKLLKKKLDMVVANDISDATIGFQSDENAVVILGQKEPVSLNRSPKRLIAQKIVEIISRSL